MSDFDLDALGDTPHIVVVVRDHMSGVLYSIPHARAIRRRFPGAKITLLTSSYSLPILDAGAVDYDQVLPLFTFSDEPQRFDRVKDLWSKFRTWAKLVGRVDLVVHLRDVGGATLVFSALLGLPTQAGPRQDRRFNWLLSVTTPRPDLTQGSRQRNTQILEALGIPVESEAMEMEIAPVDVEFARGWIERHGHDPDDGVIVVHPGCHWGCNQWLIDRWQSTIVELLERHGGVVVVTGSSRERAMTEQIVQGVPGGRCLNSAGETTLGQFSAFVSLASLVVAVDTAPTQICQAMNIPAVIMMGDGTMSWNGPIGDEPMIMLQELDPNRPPEICSWEDGACNGPKCTSRLTGISEDVVLESTEVVLSGRTNTAP